MIGVWKGFLLNNVAEWGLPAGGEWSFVLFNNYQPQWSNVDVMWFHNGGAFPRVVVKFCDDPTPLKLEFENMQRAYQCAPAIVPKPLHFGRQGRQWGLWMDGVPGSVLTTSESYAPDVLRALVEMVASLHIAASSGRQDIDPSRYRRMVQEPLESLVQFGPSLEVKTGCAELAAAISPEWLHSLPVIPQHGDLYSGNVLSNKKRFYVVDWENFGAVDLPFYDLLTLLYSLVRGTEQVPATGFPAQSQQFPLLIRDYAGKLRLSPADVRLLLPLALLNWFHLHFKGGRKAFTEKMYRTIQQYFNDPNTWNRVFLGRD